MTDKPLKLLMQGSPIKKRLEKLGQTGNKSAGIFW